MEDNLAHRKSSFVVRCYASNDCWLIRCDVVTVTTDVLPGDVLLEIFDFCVVGCQHLTEVVFSGYYEKMEIESW